MGNNLLEQCHKIKEEISNETTFHLELKTYCLCVPNYLIS